MDAVKKKVIVIYCYYSDDILLSLSILLWLLLLINRCALLCYSLPMFHDDWPLGQWWFAIAIYVKWPKGMYIYIYGRSSIYRWFHRDSMGFPDKRLTQRKKKKKNDFGGPQNWIGRLQCGYQAANSLQWLKLGYPLVICYIAIENGTFIVDLPIKDGDFLRLC